MFEKIAKHRSNGAYNDGMGDMGSSKVRRTTSVILWGVFALEMDVCGMIHVMYVW